MLTRRRVLGVAGAACVAPLPAWAAYPERSVRVVVPYAAGGNVDLVARLIGPRLAERLGQPFVVENRAGAGGSIGAAEVARAAPDGYAVLAGSNGPLTVNPLVQARLAYDPMRDFAPVALIATVPLVLMVGPNVAARSLPELVAASKARPGSVGTGTPGAGSAAHLALELFNAATGAGLLHVPYRGGGAIVPDLLAGNVPATLIEFSTALPLQREGRTRILAIAAPRRSPLLPEVPTCIEAGVPDFTAAAYVGLLLPRGAPAAVVDTVRTAVAATVAEPAFRGQLEGMGSVMAEGAQMTPEGFADFLRAQATSARRAAELAGLKPE